MNARPAMSSNGASREGACSWHAPVEQLDPGPGTPPMATPSRTCCSTADGIAAGGYRYPAGANRPLSGVAQQAPDCSFVLRCGHNESGGTV